MVGRDLVADGLWEGSLLEWQASRVSAEQAARRATTNEEIQLVDIQKQLEMEGGAVLAERAIAIELRYELDEVAPIRSTLLQIQHLLANEAKVAYVSDMYLPLTQVTAMLEKAGLPRAPVFLSSELGLTKRSGSLFKHVAASFGVPLAEVEHTGDHRDSDYHVPRSLGMKAHWFAESSATAFEMETHRALADVAPLLAATLAGAMRAARLRVGSCETSSDHLVRLGTQEAALIHIGFVLWLMEEAIRLRPEKICFLARDGYLPSRVFHALGPSFAAALPAATYIYASRQALHLAGLGSRLTEEDRAWIMVPSAALTFKDWLFRLGITSTDVRSLAREDLQIPAEQTRFADCKHMCKALLESEPFVALALQKGREARRLAAEYLSPALVPGRGPTMLVDIGWNGRMQRSVVDILSLSDDARRKINGFYVGVLRTPAGDFGRYTAWLFDLRSEKRPYCASHFQLFETLYAAPHPTTYGYSREPGGAVVADLAPSDSMSTVWPALIRFQDTIVRLSGSIRCDRDELSAAQATLREHSRRTVAALFRAPRREQARAFEGMTFSSDQTDMDKNRLLYRLNWPQQYLLFLRSKSSLSANHWREGQLALADAPGLRRAYAVISTVRLWKRQQLSTRDVLRRTRLFFGLKQGSV